MSSNQRDPKNPTGLQPFDEHNRTLGGLVHPPEHQDPVAAGRYKLVVVGGGPAGLVTAVVAANLGARVALVERHLLGGDCLNVGCVPSKALIRSARAAADIRKAASLGVVIEGEVRVDFPRVMERVRRLRAELARHDSAQRFTELGIDVFLGQGVFTGPETLAVNGQELHFDRACIATGARPSLPPIPGLEGDGILSNETLFDLTELPGRLLVLGAGPIGCEMAQCFARFGSRVTLVDRGDQVLPREDREAAEVVQAALRADGVELVLGAEIEAVERSQGEIQIRLRNGDGSRVLEGDRILVAAGRAPNVEGLGLEDARVRYDRKAGVEVDDFLCTSNPRIFAAGDVCFPFKFTHTADFLARAVIRNALFPLGRARASTLTIPWVTYTQPELAHVGLSEVEAARRGIEVDGFVQPFSGVDRAVLEGESEGFVKVLVAKGSDRILGATIVGAHAGEWISEISVAMRGGVGLGALGSVIHPYPTGADALRKCGDLYGKTRLRPWVKKLLQWFLG